MAENMHIFKRKIYKKMLEWKDCKEGSTALLIKGARRVGKSTIAEEFAKKEYESYIKIDFANAPKAVWEAVDNIADLDDFYMRIQFIYGVQLRPRKSVVIFDEIQKAPLVRQAIKYMVADGRFDFIETGSLLSIKKNTVGIVIPSEETRLTMYPMDYEEFREAIGKPLPVELLAAQMKSRKPLGDQLIRQMMREFRLYVLVGGMPQAVATYLNHQNLQEVDGVKREILELYFDDFNKIDPTGKIERLFRSIPSQLTGNSAGYGTRKILENVSDTDKITELIKELEDSLTVNIAHRVNDPSPGMASHVNYDRYKIFLGDTGLFVTLTFWDKDVIDNEIYQKLLSDKLPVDLGYVFENVVAQMLVAAGNKLFYYVWPTETGKHNYEIDFLLVKGKKIDPVEVKSSGYKTHVSLDRFMEKYSNRIGEGFLLYGKDFRKEGPVTCLPLFMTPFL